MASCILDSRLPKNIKELLATRFHLIEFATDGLVYPEVSGHPDLFLCRPDSKWVMAPGLSASLISTFQKSGMNFQSGSKPPGHSYPSSAAYCGACDSQIFIHNTTVTGSGLLEMASGLTLINVEQGYTRCSLVLIPGRRYLTSDKEIDKTMRKYGFTGLYINPLPISLPGFKHGFFGGCCGIFEDTLYVTGSLSCFTERQDIIQLTTEAGLKIRELSDSPPIDCGSLLFC